MEWEVLEVWVEICMQGKAEEGVERKTDPPGWKLKDEKDQEEEDWKEVGRQISVCATGQQADN